MVQISVKGKRCHEQQNIILGQQETFEQKHTHFFVIFTILVKFSSRDVAEDSTARAAETMTVLGAAWSEIEGNSIKRFTHCNTIDPSHFDWQHLETTAA